MILRVTSRWKAHAACDHNISHLISIQNPDADLGGLRPASIPPENHLLLLFEDVSEPLHPRGPKEIHLHQLFNWVQAVDRDELRGLVVHCDAGVSRSTASAWLTLVLLEPEVSPQELLERVETCTGSGYCFPSGLMVAIADDLLECEGKLVEALAIWKAEQRTW